MKKALIIIGIFAIIGLGIFFYMKYKKKKGSKAQASSGAGAPPPSTNPAAGKPAASTQGLGGSDVA